MAATSLQLRLQPVAHSGRMARLAVEKLCMEQGVGLADRNAILVALEEIVMNVLRHGEATSIHLVAHYEPGMVHVLVEDDGPDYNPLNYPEPDTTSPLQQRNAGGLGIHLMKQFSTEVSYERIAGRNRLKMKRVLGAERESRR